MRGRWDKATFLVIVVVVVLLLITVPKSCTASGSHSPPSSPCPVSDCQNLPVFTRPSWLRKRQTVPPAGPQGPCLLGFSVWDWFS